MITELKYDAHILCAQKAANKIARAEGFARATEIEYTGQKKVIDYVSFGYRKYTTGEYVCNAYRAKFGWKNTYYQHAICVVSI